MIKIAIVEVLKAKTIKDASVSHAMLTRINDTYDNLMELDDHIIKLIIENSAADALLHNLKLHIEDPEAQVGLYGHYSYAGAFRMPLRTVVIADMGSDRDYGALVAHELTHAVSALAFRFDVPAFEAGLKNRLIDSKMQAYLAKPILPCTSDDNQIFNPEILKFKQCVREDYARFLQEKRSFSGEPRLDDYFENLERRFPEGILETESLCEVLPIYMECRVQLFKRVKENKMTKEQALRHLEEQLPRIHDYVETDFKKVLQQRLEHYYFKLHSAGYEVQCVQLHMKPTTNRHVGTLFHHGVLRFSHTARLQKDICKLLIESDEVKGLNKSISTASENMNLHVKLSNNQHINILFRNSINALKHKEISKELTDDAEENTSSLEQASSIN
ncbi:MAG: hypothetical protein P4L79_02975 [Legionella sp.]|uniref:hypothetical protein n=1 Tax=Legionella sp. TaxID=459 RepID=UPI00284663CD|nr:hypothetical protein [Legionella sp.]